jgi:DNA topoisomerase-1
MKWTSLQYEGPFFPKPYEYKKIKIKIKGKLVALNKEAEEYGILFSKYLNTKYMHDPLFLQNFWNDFQTFLSSNIQANKLEDFDFENYTRIKHSPIKSIVSEHSKYALINGKKQELQNYKMEPPGIFIGRGLNPNRGKIKVRILPQDVIINTSNPQTLKNPKQWKELVMDQEASWVANWNDPITHKKKYVFPLLAFKSQSYEEKFDFARLLKQHIQTIRKQYLNDLKSQDLKTQQLATIVYFVDTCAMRIGNKKSPRDTQTLGISTLQKKNIQLKNNHVVEFDFISKDSMRYQRSIKVIQQVYKNLTKFLNEKNTLQVFYLADSSAVNAYLDSFLLDLTSKVWRTYNASEIMYQKLKKSKDKESLLQNFEDANEEIAILCNHLIGTKQDLNMSTSILNYIDPRIIISFAKKFKVDFLEFYNESELKKFHWALTTTSANFKF